MNTVLSVFAFYAVGIKPIVNPRAYVMLNDSLIHALEPPSGGELKLTTNLNAESWAYNWIMYISSDETPEYDEHFYMDYFNMRGIANMCTSSEYLYLGYTPKDYEEKFGPKYLGVFYLDFKKRTLNSKLIMENPHYVSYDSRLKEFKDEISKLSDKAFVFFVYSELNRPEQLRYYLEWKY